MYHESFRVCPCVQATQGWMNWLKKGCAMPLQVRFDLQDPFTAAASDPAVLFCTSGGLLGTMSTATAVRAAMHSSRPPQWP